MRKALSRDGTAIAFERSGEGPPLILVDGALCSRSFGPMPKLAPLLAQRFTVFTYDRRGRGDSGDAPAYAVQREVEDIEALINEAGGSAYVYGISSGAALALEAAARGLSISKLAVYEPPFIVDDSHPPVSENYIRSLTGLIEQDRRGEAVKLFMKVVGVPTIAIAMMRFMPAWSKLKAVAHTLPYDFTILADNQKGKPLRAAGWASVTAPTLVMSGGKSDAWIRNAAQAVVYALPNAKQRTLEGQTHNVAPRALAPVLQEFFSAEHGQKAIRMAPSLG
jgi:pimeloyl-ACP methyl ester carboxylesterase